MSRYIIPGQSDQKNRRTVTPAGTLKRRERKRRERKTRHQSAGVEIARTENAAPKCRGGNGEALSPWGR